MLSEPIGFPIPAPVDLAQSMDCQRNGPLGDPEREEFLRLFARVIATFDAEQLEAVRALGALREQTPHVVTLIEILDGHLALRRLSKD